MGWLRRERTAPAPDWEALHLERFDRFTVRDQTPGMLARNDQAEAEFAGHLAALGVDLGDPVALHAVLAGLSTGAVWACRLPLSAGPQLGYHVRALGRRVEVLR